MAFGDGDGSSEGNSNSTGIIDDGNSTIPSCFDFTDGVKSMTIQQCEESCISEGFTGGSKQGWGYPPVKACYCVGSDIFGSDADYLCQDVLEVPTCSSVGVTSLRRCSTYCNDPEGDIDKIWFDGPKATFYSVFGYGCECGDTYELVCQDDDDWGVGDVADDTINVESNESFVIHITNVVVWATVAQAFLWMLVDI